MNVNGNLGISVFINHKKFFAVNQEIHIYFVIKCQACGWFLNLVVHEGLQWIKGYHLESSNIERDSVVTAVEELRWRKIHGSGHFFLCWLPHLSKHQKQNKKTKKTKTKAVLNRYLHKGSHKIQCFCILCYVTVQFCVLYYTVWLQDFCAL